jgi:hypothetical protein
MPARGTGPATATLALLAALAALAGTSCGDPASPPADSIELSIETHDPPNVLTLRLRLDRAAAVEVEYWRSEGERLRVQAEAGAEHAILLSRLRAGSTYEYDVRTLDEHGQPIASRSGQLTTGPLPADLAAIGFAATGTPASPLALLVANSGGTDGFSGYVIVDWDGEVVWYIRVNGPSGITRRANGNFVYTSIGGLVEVTPTWEIVAEVLTDPQGRRFHHDVIATPDHTVLAIATDTQTVGGTRFTGEAIWEWTPETGSLEKRWTAFDVLDPFLDRGPRFNVDNWLHANSLALGSRGNVLVSSNYLNQILSVAPDFLSLEWRLGGTNATITVPEAERFSGQHTAAEVEGGRILLFDNRREQGGYSRAVEFELEDAEAHRVWEWRPERDNFASVLSSARRLPDGGTLVAFGTSAGLVESSGPIEVYDVGPTGAVRWHLEVSGLFALYRAEPLTDIAGETLTSGPH